MANSDRLTTINEIYYFQIVIWMVGKMKLYLDVIWLLNFFIDLSIILLTAIFMKQKVSKIRVILGAFIASFYLFFIFSPLDAIAMNPFVKSLYSLLIILVSFRFVRFRLFLQTWLTFYFVNFALGGGLLGVHYFFDYETSFINGTFATRTSGFGSPISWIFVIVGFPLIYLFSKKRLETIETEKIRYEQIYPVTVMLADIHLQLRGFVDSGNRVEDPLSRRPVMFIDMTEVAEQFPPSLVQFTKNLRFSKVDNVPKEFEGKLTIVPYRTVSDTNQFIWALKPDKVYVYNDGKKFDVSNILIGLSYFPLSDRKDYNCLLHPTMMQKKKVINDLGKRNVSLKKASKIENSNY